MTRFLIVLTAGALFAASAVAQDFRDPVAAFDDADADRNGVVTHREFTTARMANFARMDRNRDGAVSQADFRRIARIRPDAVERLDGLIAQGDANRDGRLTRAEMAAAPTPVFDRADSNRDGAVDKAELAALSAAFKGRR